MEAGAECSHHVRPGGRGPGKEFFTSIYYKKSPISCRAPAVTLPMPCPNNMLHSPGDPLRAPPPSMAEPWGDLMATAAAQGDLGQLEVLLQRAPDVNATNRFGRTALQVMRLGNPAIAKLLLSRGADPNLRDRTGFTPLHDAARTGFQDTLQALLEFHADVNIEDNEGNLPLHLAAREGHLHVVKFLSLHTDSDVGHPNRNGDTPCDMARLYSKEDVLQWLLSDQAGTQLQ
ncbi:cyclin-dependent kinase 4 inhibitor C [Ascaphus truei]|uniref:cyclin-dependent kinase 4 inhibitor C n=1 Tax=Ascaphus truei TaxID=8439 RepID=UPI003F5A79B1